MSTLLGDTPKRRSSVPTVPKLNSRYNRVSSAITPSLLGEKRSSPRQLQSATVTRSNAKKVTPQYAQPTGNTRRGLVSSSKPLLPPHTSSFTRPSAKDTAAAAHTSTTTTYSSRRTNSAQGPAPPAPLQRCVSAAYVERRCRYVVATMKHCGSIYEEMTRQLLATGRWSHVTVRQRSVTKTLFVSETQRDLADMNVHLLLGEKMPCERVIAARREATRRYQARLSDAAGGSSSGSKYASYGPRQYPSLAVRMPMGNGDDGEPRVVDFVENTRSITLKSSMVTNLLKHHRYDWGSLSAYLPMAFKLLPRQPNRDDRLELLATARRSVGHSVNGAEGSCMWIAKSSSGCHGDNIEIFEGDQAGLSKLLRFIDSQRENNAWIAQQYIDRPLLYHKRKFDIRCWALLLRDKYEIYVHEELVMRMSSVPYNRDTATSKTANGRLAHITNHCVQETGAAYSLYEEGNELWRDHLDGLIRYKGAIKLERLKQERLSPGRSPRLTEPASGGRANMAAASSSASGLRDSPYPMSEVRRSEGSSTPAPRSARGAASPITLNNYIMPQIHAIVRDTLIAARTHVPEEPPVPPTHTFQVFGYDFLIDEDLKVWLLEVNGAPGGPDRLKPALMKDTIELAVAPFFPGTMNLKTERHNGYVRVYP